MKIRSDNFDAQCWSIAKEHFKAMDKKHIIRMIEYIAKKRMKR